MWPRPFSENTLSVSLYLPTYLTDRVKSPGLLLLGLAKKLPSTPLVSRRFSASTPVMLGWNHLEGRKTTLRTRHLSNTHTITAENPHTIMVDACEQQLTASFQARPSPFLSPFSWVEHWDPAILQVLRRERGTASRAGLFTQWTRGFFCPKRSSIRSGNCLQAMKPDKHKLPHESDRFGGSQEPGSHC